VWLLCGLHVSDVKTYSVLTSLPWHHVQKGTRLSPSLFSIFVMWGENLRRRLHVYGCSVLISFHRIVMRQICYWVKGHSNWGTYGFGIFTELVVHISCRCISTSKLISSNHGDSEFSPGLFSVVLYHSAFAGFPLQGMLRSFDLCSNATLLYMYISLPSQPSLYGEASGLTFHYSHHSGEDPEDDQ